MAGKLSFFIINCLNKYAEICTILSSNSKYHNIRFAVKIYFSLFYGNKECLEKWVLLWTLYCVICFFPNTKHCTTKRKHCMTPRNVLCSANMWPPCSLALQTWLCTWSSFDIASERVSEHNHYVSVYVTWVKHTGDQFRWKRNRAAVCVLWAYAVGLAQRACICFWCVCVLAMCSPYKVIMSRIIHPPADGNFLPKAPNTMRARQLARENSYVSAIWCLKWKQNHFWPRAPTAERRYSCDNKKSGRGSTGRLAAHFAAFVVKELFEKNFQWKDKQKLQIYLISFYYLLTTPIWRRFRITMTVFLGFFSARFHY